jgi:hypothetical protein
MRGMVCWPLLRRRCFVAAALLVCAVASRDLCAQMKELHVNPHETDAAIEMVQGPHVAVYDPSAKPAHRVLVFLPGTNAKAERSLAMYRAFADWGYHAIGLDYENSVAAVSCAHSKDAACFDHYRDAVVSGAPMSEKITVDRANSILSRLEKLLLFLVKTDPDGGWGEFVEAGRPKWSRIVIAGHSQGSGHAAYIGKMFEVERVLMFSGPQDYLDDLGEPAEWESWPSATPPARFFAFLNLNDPYNEQHQVANCAVLMKLARPETQMVKAAEAGSTGAPGTVIQGNPQILVNTTEASVAHGSTIQPEFAFVWRYMSSATLPNGDINPEPPAPLHPIAAR